MVHSHLIHIHGRRVGGRLFSSSVKKVFTVSEIRPISDANEKERQTQQRWIQYVTGNPDPRTFTTETPFKARTAT